MKEYIVTEDMIDKKYADANCEELVKCKDCRWYEIRELKQDGTDDRRYKPSLCVLQNREYKEDFFCAYGERIEV